MNKRIITVAAVAAIAVGTLAGCSTTATATHSTSAAKSATSSVPSPTVAAPKKAAVPAKPAAPAKPAVSSGEAQATIAAHTYLTDGQGFSYQGLIDQLTSSYGNGFSVADATAAVNSMNADYNAQAVIAAKNYLSDGQGFSHASLVAQLDSAFGNKFTPAQADAGATGAGI